MRTKSALILLCFIDSIQISQQKRFLFCCSFHKPYILCEASLIRRTCCILQGLERSFSSLLFSCLFLLWKIYSLDKLTWVTPPLCEASLIRRTCCILQGLERSFSSLLFSCLFLLWKIYSLDKLTWVTPP